MNCHEPILCFNLIFIASAVGPFRAQTAIEHKVSSIRHYSYILCCFQSTKSDNNIEISVLKVAEWPGRPEYATFLETNNFGYSSVVSRLNMQLSWRQLFPLLRRNDTKVNNNQSLVLISSGGNCLELRQPRQKTVADNRNHIRNCFPAVSLP